MSGWGNIGRPLVIIITVAIASMTAVASFLVYTAQQTTESRVELVASQTLRGALAEESMQASSEIAVGLRNMERTLSAAAGAISGMDPADSPARQTLALTESALTQYTDNIVWLSEDGALAYTTREDMAGMVGTDLSDRRFYEITFATNRPFISSSLLGVDGTPSFAVAVPVPDAAGDFDGVLAALVPVSSVKAAFLEPQVFGSKPIMVLTNDGTILVHPEESLVGKNINDGEVSATISEDTLEVAEKNFELMVQGRSGVLEYADSEGEETLMAYEPVTISNAHTWTVAVFEPTSTVREPFLDIFAERQSYTLIATGLIAAISAVFIGFILVLNKRLFTTVSRQDEKITNQLQELKGAYQRLKEQDVIKDEFINIAAHELRTPVLPIVLSAENLADSMPEDDNVRIILRNANRITKLTNDILDVSRIESNTFKLQKQKTDIRRVVEEVLMDAQLKILKGQDVELALESTLPKGTEELMMDKGRISQVLINLVDNAINFTESGTIRVVLAPEDADHIRVSVIDSGKGIYPEVRERLFGKFVSKTDRAKGTGLGLYLCKAIVEAHNGTIRGENNAEGRGATFSFTLPLS
ncbi:ATP-binding protein [Candidatus Nitrososphaera sp. FF02]|uniref:sensor histidine kinase n=1 Tax=Candidatus Nitrososphaera sp. FF02 TaxID=3398226 RepID=UPI0039E9D019